MISNVQAVALALCACGCASVPQPDLSLPADGGPVALITPSALVVAFPPEPRADTGWHPLSLDNASAGYFWHIMFRGTPEWLAAGFTVDPDLDLQIPSFPSLQALVAAGHLSACRLDTHIIICGIPLRGRARAEAGRVIVTITDREWLPRLQGLHPTSVHLSRGQENLKYLWRDTVIVTHREPPR